ncbi:BCL2/adenovirus E1B 19 kDa protein-interacting protein 2 isoform X2 [Coregonus clupeaformis]|uniref:BCL2/adenovirus E1B 19 kDa protein-interacting protein 2 isoform X1 n=1 Tax=Coregonus clupeaformis TaxID=59861 RepID=UPI001E1C834F|nr:BCL2/adenovirus E1B 19 kDa protein-interacting protein 2 isoform X1 [Coregonus clupeaformis]XP_045068715.1 BCL2/adenovirus E1B 19 kDa protein-interacting protein 2 isoform X2 [Coregonus clupeaformis]
MATDMTEGEVVLKAAGENVSPDLDTDTPRIYESLGGDIRATPSPSSSGVSGGEEELQNSSTGPSLENGEEAAPGAALQTGGPPQETVTPNNGEKQEEGVEVVPCSTPVRMPQTSSTSGHNGSLERQESVATSEARLRMEGVELKEEWQDEDFPSLERQESVATSEARLRMEGVELKEEWQDEDFPRPLPEEEEEDIQLGEDLFTGTSGEGQSASAGGYAALSGGKKTKKKLAAPDISLTLDRSEGSLLSDELEESTELDLDDVDTPSDNSNEFEWEDDLPKPKTTEVLQKGVESVQEYSASEEREEGRRWRVFRIGDQEHKVDMKAIEPYKRVISHGGYYGDGLNAIIVFAVCYMPESNQPNYRYIMDNLFKYVIGTLELLVAENYMIVYLNGATSRKKMPSVGWLRKCYQQINRRLRKNLKSLIIVHPSWFIRTLLALTKLFISSKFSQKIQFVFNLTDLSELVPMEYVSIPDCIKELDQEKHVRVAGMPETE